jgi:YebC/PmpR family DNA-binding regulatory protein
MSGHSKWATTKHKKAALDKTRGKLFAKIIRQVEVAARDGGGDAEANPTLRTMFQKARAASIPLDTIEKAIKRGTGELEGVRYEPITYEGYAPCGVAVYVEALSDNRNRTSAEVRSTFSKLGGSIAEPGAVSWQFHRKGVFILPKSSGSEDDLMAIGIDAGLEDLEDQGDTWQMTTAPQDFQSLKQALDDAGTHYDSADLTMVATTAVPLDNESDARKVLRLLDALEDNDDVQNVFANFDIPDSVLELVEASA